MTPAEIKAEFYAHWVSPDGLAMLTPSDMRPGFVPGAPATVNNNNGILFLFYFLLLLKKFSLLDKTDLEHFRTTVGLLQERPGLYNRHPWQRNVLEAQDNYSAIAGGAAIFGLSDADRICGWGLAHGWMYNNCSPDGYLLEALRQGSEVAFYNACAGEIPALWDWIWLLGNIAVSWFQKNASNQQLAWLKIEVLASLNETTWPWWQVLSGNIWIWIWRLRYRNPFVFISQYFTSDHPIYKLAQLI